MIAGLTLREFARRRIVWVLLGLVGRERRCSSPGASTGSSPRAREQGDVTEPELQIGVSQVLILIAFMFSFVLAMSAAFLGAPAIASDVETGTVHAMLARPLRRSELLLGRWLGLSIVVAAYAVLSGLLAIAAVGFVSGHVPPSPQVAVAFLAFQAVAVLTLAVALGTRLPSIAAGLHRRRPVRPRVVRGRAGQRRGRRSTPGPSPASATICADPAPDRRPVARRGLRPRAARSSCCSPTRRTRRPCARTRSSPPSRRRPRSSPGRRLDRARPARGASRCSAGASSEPALRATGSGSCRTGSSAASPRPTACTCCRPTRKTSAETVFVPADPYSTTWYRRPETPRCRRSSRWRSPTAVRGSFANIADSWPRVSTLVDQR